MNGRINQKRRTRSAIVTAAVDLLQQGLKPTVAEVADAATVSRATAYRYFPSQEFLLAEAVLHDIRGEVDHILELVSVSTAPAGRIDAVIQAMQERTLAREAGFRTLLRLSMEQSFEGGDGRTTPVGPRRGGRRIDWIKQALAPVWDQLDEPMQERLVGALSLCMGIEALVVLRDICEYPPEQALEICRWMAQAILDVGLEDVVDDTDLPA